MAKLSGSTNYKSKNTLTIDASANFNTNLKNLIAQLKEIPNLTKAGQKGIKALEKSLLELKGSGKFTNTEIWKQLQSAAKTYPANFGLKDTSFKVSINGLRKAKKEIDETTESIKKNTRAKKENATVVDNANKVVENERKKRKAIEDTNKAIKEQKNSKKEVDDESVLNKNELKQYLDNIAPLLADVFTGTVPKRLKELGINGNDREHLWNNVLELNDEYSNLSRKDRSELLKAFKSKDFIEDNAARLKHLIFKGKKGYDKFESKYYTPSEGERDNQFLNDGLYYLTNYADIQNSFDLADYKHPSNLVKKTEEVKEKAKKVEKQIEVATKELNNADKVLENIEKKSESLSSKTKVKNKSKSEKNHKKLSEAIDEKVKVNVPDEAATVPADIVSNAQHTIEEISSNVKNIKVQAQKESNKKNDDSENKNIVKLELNGAQQKMFDTVFGGQEELDTFVQSLKNNATRLSQSIKDTSDSIRKFGWDVGALASTIYSIRNLVTMVGYYTKSSDNLTSLGYRLKRYDKTGQSKQEILSSIYANANNARSDMETYGQLAQRILMTGVTEYDVNKSMHLASLISKSMVLGGSTAEEQRAALLQLSQGLASNTLAGDELRSLRENAIGFTDMLSKGLTKAFKDGLLTDSNFRDVKIGDLKGLGQKGLLTAKVVTTAIGTMESEINQGFGDMPVLFSQSLNKLSNIASKRLNELLGEGRGFQRIIDLVNKLADYLESGAGKKVVDNIANIIDSFISAIANLTSLITNIVNLVSLILPALTSGVVYGKALTGVSRILFGYTKKGEQYAGLASAGGFLKFITDVQHPFTTKTFDHTLMTYGGVVPNLIMSFIKGYKPGMYDVGKALKELTSGNRAGIDVNVAAGSLNKLGLNESAITTVFDTLFGRLDEYDPTVKGTRLIKTTEFQKALAVAIEKEGGLDKALIKEDAVGDIVAGKGIFSNLKHLSVLPKLGIALAAIGAVVGAYKLWDNHRDKVDLENFNSKLPDLSKYKLSEEDKTRISDKIKTFYSSNRNDFFNIKHYTQSQVDAFSSEILTDVLESQNKYLENITQNTKTTAENTASTLNITEDFIRNMSDIRTRQFKAQMMLNGGGVQGTWNVTINNNSDLIDVESRIVNDISDMLNDRATSLLTSGV